MNRKRKRPGLFHENSFDQVPVMVSKHLVSILHERSIDLDDLA